MKMSKTKLKKGRHPVAMKKMTLINRINYIAKQYDNWVRVIPSRFARVRYKGLYIEVISNPCNDKEIFLKIKEDSIFQRLKIECSCSEKALLIKQHMETVGF